MPDVPRAVINVGTCGLGINHRTKFDIDVFDFAARIANRAQALSLCGLWLDVDKLIEGDFVTCVECLAAPRGCR